MILAHAINMAGIHSSSRILIRKAGGKNGGMVSLCRSLYLYNSTFTNMQIMVGHSFQNWFCYTWALSERIFPH